MNPQTYANIMASLYGEAFAHARYLAFARAAHERGDHDLAQAFEGIASVELREHFEELAALARLVGTDADNVVAAIRDEDHEVEAVYRLYAEQARLAGEDEVAERFEEMREDELAHLKLLETLLERLEVPV